MKISAKISRQNAINAPKFLTADFDGLKGISSAIFMMRMTSLKSSPAIAGASDRRE